MTLSARAVTAYGNASTHPAKADLAGLWAGVEPYPSLAALLADPATHETGRVLSAVVGQIPQVLAVASYICVAASGNLGQVTAGGNEIDVLAGTDGRYSLTSFGGDNTGATDSHAALQRMATLLLPVVILPGTYAVNDVVQAPQGPDIGAYSINPTLDIVGQGRPTITTTLSSSHLFRGYGWGDAPGRQYHGFRVEGLDFQGPGGGSAGVLAPANCRMPRIVNNRFRGFPGGWAVDIWASGSGGSYMPLIEGNEFGLQSAQTSGATYIDVANDLMPNVVLGGVRMRGPGNSNGKVNDTVLLKNYFLGCLAGATHQGWHTAYTGLGGSGNLRSAFNTMDFTMVRDIEETLATAGSATTVTLPLPPLGINAASGTYDEFILEITAGTGVGQVREVISDVVGASRVLTVAAWDVTVDSTSVVRVTASNSALIAEYGVSNLPFGHFFDHEYSWSSFGDYIEKTNTPVLGGDNANDDFALIAPIMKVSDSKWVTRVDGTGIDPALSLFTRTRGDDDQPTNSTLTNFLKFRGQDGNNWSESGPVREALNSTGGNLASRMVARMGTSGAMILVTASGANQARPKVIADVAGRTFPDGENAPYAASGTIVDVDCDAAVVNETDTLVSQAGGLATVNNAQTDPKYIIGYAVTAKGSGAGIVSVEIL